MPTHTMWLVTRLFTIFTPLMSSATLITTHFYFCGWELLRALRSLTDNWLMARGRVRGRVIVSLFSREYHHWAAPRKELRLQSGGVCRPRARPAGQCQAQLWTGHSELETRSYNHALWVRADNIESRSLNVIVIVNTILTFYEDSRPFVSLLEKNLISCISNDCVIKC